MSLENGQVSMSWALVAVSSQLAVLPTLLVLPGRHSQAWSTAQLMPLTPEAVRPGLKMPSAMWPLSWGRGRQLDAAKPRAHGGLAHDAENGRAVAVVMAVIPDHGFPRSPPVRLSPSLTCSVTSYKHH